MRKHILNPVGMFLTGLMLGVVSRLSDIYTQNLGNVLSQMAIWILFGVMISIYSKTKKQAMLNIFPFCISMLLTYYFVAFVSKGVFSSTYIIGWTVFALFSPVLAYFAWMTKQKGILAKIISCGIVLVSILSSVLLFNGLRIYDFVIDGIMIYLLFFRKIER